MNTVNRVQILDETDCMSHGANIVEEDVNPVSLFPAMGKQ